MPETSTGKAEYMFSMSKSYNFSINMYDFLLILYRKMLRLTIESDNISAVCPNNKVFNFKSDIYSVAKFLEDEVRYLQNTRIKYIVTDIAISQS